MSLTSIIPGFIDALIAAAVPALPGVTVADGAPTEMAEGSWLYVGVDDPEVVSWVAGTSTQDWAVATMTSRNEDATVTCAVSTFSGSLDQKAARDAAFSIAGTVQTLCRDPSTFQSLGGVYRVNYARQTFRQSHDAYGSYCLLVFQLDLKARI